MIGCFKVFTVETYMASFDMEFYRLGRRGSGNIGKVEDHVAVAEAWRNA